MTLLNHLKILHFNLSEGEVTNSGLGVGKKDQVRGKIIETIDSTSVDDVLVICEPTVGLGTGAHSSKPRSSRP